MPGIKNLSGLRQRIDQIDSDILNLLSERLQLTAKIGRIKSELNKPVIDQEREADLTAKLYELCDKQDLDKKFVSGVWDLILKESYRMQDGKK